MRIPRCRRVSWLGGKGAGGGPKPPGAPGCPYGAAAWSGPAAASPRSGSDRSSGPGTEVADEQRGTGDRARHQHHRDERDQEQQHDGGAEADGETLAAAQQPEPLTYRDVPALHGHRGQLDGEEEAGDTEADRGDHGLPDERDEPEDEQQKAETGGAQQHMHAVPQRDPDLLPQRPARGRRAVPSDSSTFSESDS